MPSMVARAMASESYEMAARASARPRAREPACFFSPGLRTRPGGRPGAAGTSASGRGPLVRRRGAALLHGHAEPCRSNPPHRKTGPRRLWTRSDSKAIDARAARYRLTPPEPRTRGWFGSPRPTNISRACFETSGRRGGPPDGRCAHSPIHTDSRQTKRAGESARGRRRERRADQHLFLNRRGS